MNGWVARKPVDSEFDLLVLGDCNPDLVLTGDEIDPSFGQVERLVDDADLMIGGSGGILACGAARLGLRTAFVGMVGDDVFGQFMRDALTERGVDTNAIVVDPRLRTGVTVILSRPGDRAILTFPGTVAALDAADVDPELIISSRHVHVASYFLQTSLAPGLPALFQRARRAGVTTSVDPNWDPDEQWDSGIRELLSLVDLFLPNAEEATRIGGAQDVRDAALALAARGPLTAVKRGAAGALAVDNGGQIVEIPGLGGVETVDAVGAGDSFDAGLLTGLLSGWTIDRALSLGCACGALSTRAIGGTSAQPTLAEAVEAVALLNAVSDSG
ncbi:MAG: carbohydrate kinase family protein [Solirubrobacteraceae bacterium]